MSFRGVGRPEGAVLLLLLRDLFEDQDPNAMLAGSATIRVDAVAAPIDRVAREVLDPLARLDAAL